MMPVARFLNTHRLGMLVIMAFGSEQVANLVSE